MPDLSSQINTPNTGLLSEALFISRYHFLDTVITDNNKTKTITDSDDEEENEKLLLCAHCSHVISSRQHATEFNGQHVYCFRNPAGIEYVIGCFNRADGCAVSGLPETRWSWFPPHAWTMALCGSCGTHLGWHYSKVSDHGFYGLILKQLQES